MSFDKPEGVYMLYLQEWTLTSKISDSFPPFPYFNNLGQI